MVAVSDGIRTRRTDLCALDDFTFLYGMALRPSTCCNPSTWFLCRCLLRRTPVVTPQITKDLHATIKPEDPNADTVDNSRGTLLLEILALEIQMYTDQRDNKRLREIYDQTLHVKSAIPHPRIMGVIRECGGKMHMTERGQLVFKRSFDELLSAPLYAGEWAKAQIDFFEAFRNYDEAGSPQRIQVLKYLVLAHMLMGSEIDPFDSQETKP